MLVSIKCSFFFCLEEMHMVFLVNWCSQLSASVLMTLLHVCLYKMLIFFLVSGRCIWVCFFLENWCASSSCPCLPISCFFSWKLMCIFIMLADVFQYCDVNSPCLDGDDIVTLCSWWSIRLWRLLPDLVSLRACCPGCHYFLCLLWGFGTWNKIQIKCLDLKQPWLVGVFLHYLHTQFSLHISLIYPSGLHLLASSASN